MVVAQGGIVGWAAPLAAVEAALEGPTDMMLKLIGQAPARRSAQHRRAWSVITFILTRALPGDPAAYFAGGAATQEAVDQVREQLGLNRTLIGTIHGLRRGDLARGDLGTLAHHRPAGAAGTDRRACRPRWSWCCWRWLLACAIALPLGVLAATRPGSWIDQLCRLVTTAGVSLPTFFTGLLLAYVFYFLLGWAPSPLGRLDPMFSPPATVTGLYLIDARDRR